MTDRSLEDERAAQVRELIAGAWMTQAIHHAVRLGLFDPCSNHR